MRQLFNLIGRSGFLLLFFSAALLAVWLRYDVSTEVYSIDETLITEIIQSMFDNRNLDANFNQIVGGWFPGAEYHQYIFSSYIVSARLWVEFLQVAILNKINLWVAVRAWGCALDLATFFLVFGIGKMYSGRAVGLLAAFLYAISPTAVFEAHWIRPDVYMSFAAAGIAMASLYMSRYFYICTLLAAMLSGAAFACKFSGLLLIAAPFIALVYRPVPGSGLTFSRAASWLVISIAGFVIGFGLSSPYALINFEKFLWGTQFVFWQYSLGQPSEGSVYPGLANPILDALGFYMLALGPFFCATVVLAFWLGWRNKTERRKLMIIASVPMVCLASIATQQQFSIRNISHAMPVLCVLASAGAMGFYNLIKSNKKFPIAKLIAIAFLVSSPSFVYATLLVTNYMRGNSDESFISYENALMEKFPQKKLAVISYPDIWMFKLPERNEGNIYRLDIQKSSWDQVYLSEIMNSDQYRIISEYKTPFYYFPQSDILGRTQSSRVYFESR
jgi:4-amino-4-deoxy-L-arabinose transferase-like glycosyltransferase